MKKSFFKLVSILLIAALSIPLFAACTDNGGNTQANASSYVLLSINPAVELVTDSEGNVISYTPANEDAEILFSETDLTGMTAEEAAETFVGLATEAGYISPDKETNEINITVVGEDDEESDNLYGKISERAKKVFDKKGIKGQAVRAKLEELKTAAEQYGISVQKMRLINAAMEINPDYTIEELVAKTIKELTEILKEKFEELKDVAMALREDYHELKDVIKNKYSEMFALEDEIDDLEDQLEDFEGTEEEKAALEAQLSEKEAMFKEQFALYKAEIEAARNSYKDQSSTLKNEIKDIRGLKNQFKDFEDDDAKAELEAEAAKREAEYRQFFEAYKTQIEQAKNAFENQIALRRQAKQEINNLKDSLEDFTGTEEEKAALETQLDELEAQYETNEEMYENLFESYKSELETAKETYREQAENMKNQMNGILQQKREQIKNRVHEIINGN